MSNTMQGRSISAHIFQPFSLQFPLRLSILFVCLGLLLFPAYGQNGKNKPEDFGIKSKKALKYYETGMQLAQIRDRANAMEQFRQAVALEPEFAHAHYQLGVNAYVKKAYKEALPHLQKAYELRADAFRAISFYLGVVSFYNAQYDDAEKYLQQFLNRREGRKVDIERAERLYRHSAFARIAIQDSVQFDPINLGEQVNTNRDEYLPLLTADDSYLLFTSRRPESVGGYNRQMRNYNEDFFFSVWRDSGWTSAQNLGLPINSPDNEGAASLSQDGQTLYFTACNRPDGLGACDIYVAYREGDRWSRPKNLGPEINGEGWDGEPCLTPDGKTLYFTSARSGGQGGRDIWFSQRQGTRWLPAQNLGPVINTPGNENSPFLHADGVTLYFSSDYHLGFGGHDIFVSYYDPGQGWSKPRNLGYPLNTPAYETHVFVNSSGKRGFINSDREGGFGGSDLYEFELDTRIRPKQATYLRGVVMDSITEVPIYARLRLIDVETGDTLRDTYTHRSNGSFLMSLPLEREYAAYVEAPGYLFSSRNFYLKDMKEEVYFDLIVQMKPLRKETQFVLPNIFFDTGKWSLKATSQTELEFLAYFLKQNPGLRIEIQGHTDDVGSEEDNVLLSQRRAEAVRDYLLTQAIDPGRLVAKGYGESMPVAGNITEEDRARNRRTEIKILETSP